MISPVAAVSSSGLPRNIDPPGEFRRVPALLLETGSMGRMPSRDSLGIRSRASLSATDGPRLSARQDRLANLTEARALRTSSRIEAHGSKARRGAGRSCRSIAASGVGSQVKAAGGAGRVVSGLLAGRKCGDSARRREMTKTVAFGAAMILGFGPPATAQSFPRPGPAAARSPARPRRLRPGTRCCSTGIRPR